MHNGFVTTPHSLRMSRHAHIFAFSPIQIIHDLLFAFAIYCFAGNRMCIGRILVLGDATSNWVPFFPKQFIHLMDEGLYILSVNHPGNMSHLNMASRCLQFLPIGRLPFAKSGVIHHIKHLPASCKDVTNGLC